MPYRPLYSRAVTTSVPRRRGPIRDRELLATTLDVLAETGYDRLNLDVVATRARASKATLYRRWPSKAALVVAAFVQAVDHSGVAPDTGSLREDLLQVVTRISTEMRRLGDLIAALLPEMRRNPELATAYDEQFVQPRYRSMASVFQRAAERGELASHADLTLIWQVVPAILLYRTLTPGAAVDAHTPQAIVDHVLMPLLSHADRPRP